MVLVLVAQAETEARHTPRAFCLMAMLPPAMLEIIIGTNSGDTLSGPSSWQMIACLYRVLMPPMPEPAYTPNLSGSMFSPLTSPLCLTASSADATANWVKRSYLLASPAFIPKSAGLKSLTCAATLIGSGVSSNPVMRSMPQRPARTDSQTLSTLFPIGEIAPSPVMTTLLVFSIICIFAL